MILFFSLLASRHFDLFFFFNDTATTEIYTLSLHDALPIFFRETLFAPRLCFLHWKTATLPPQTTAQGDRKSTRLNSSHSQISYAVFCLKKKKSYDTNQPAVFGGRRSVLSTNMA